VIYFKVVLKEFLVYVEINLVLFAAAVAVAVAVAVAFLDDMQFKMNQERKKKS